MKKKIKHVDDIPTGTIGGYVVVRKEDNEIRDAYTRKVDALEAALAMAGEYEQTFVVLPAEPFLVREWESWCWFTEKRLVRGQVMELAVADRSD
jgi:hypothetical protein